MTARGDDGGPAALVRPLVAELDALVATTRDVRDALAALPGLMNDWTVGQPVDAQTLVVEVLPGRGAVAAMWARLASGRACVVLPDPRALGELAARPDLGAVRVVVGATDADETRVALDKAARLGVAVRSLADPPSWFAVDDADTCAYPSAWETGRPEHVLLLHDPVAAGGFRVLFDELWRRAAPLESPDPGWAPVLQLLDRGLTEAEAAAILHVSERTVRRRIRAAAEALEARNLFTLGLAWAGRAAGGADRRTEPS